jgi:hypothetical protein
MALPEEIEFVHDWFAEIEGAPGRLRQLSFRKGARMRAEVRHVPREKGRAEAADLRLADGTTALRVPLMRFRVVEDQARAA